MVFVQHALAYAHHWVAGMPHALFRGLLFFGVMGAVYIPLDHFFGGDVRRFFTRTFLNDFGYGMLARIGLYGFIYGWLFVYLQTQFSFFHVKLLEHLPLVVAVIVSVLVFDCVGYWIHRLQHESDYLWAFHSVHHAQTNLTFATGFRGHILDEVNQAFIGMIPGLILGFPEGVWPVLVLVRTLNVTFVHSGLPIGYGPLYRVFVSPKFHSYHHSAQASEYMGNYGTIFTFWDQAFGTFVRKPDMPSAFGIAGVDMGTSIVRQFLFPFRPAGAALRNLIRLGPRLRFGSSSNHDAAIPVPPPQVG